jgi:hypothetical protein
MHAIAAQLSSASRGRTFMGKMFGATALPAYPATLRPSEHSQVYAAEAKANEVATNNSIRVTLVAGIIRSNQEMAQSGRSDISDGSSVHDS